MVNKILIVEVLDGKMYVHSIYENVSAARIAFNENFEGECNEIKSDCCRVGEHRVVTVNEYLEEKLSVAKEDLLNELSLIEEAQNQYDLIASERGYCTLPPHYYIKDNEVTVEKFLE